MQTDFLAALESPVEHEEAEAFVDPVSPPRPSVPDTVEAADETEARRLEATGRFRVLRRLVHPPVRVGHVSSLKGMRIGVAVDTETTGLDPSRCETIEIGAVAFTYDDERILDVVGVFEGRQQPSRPLPAEITRLTGLTDRDLEGRSIDRQALEAFLRPADLIVAHNAAFDRGFCEGISPVFATKAWVCSAVDIDWKSLGESSVRLVDLLASVGRFHGAHRAAADAVALVEILSTPRFATAFPQLVAASREESYEIRAERTPYDARTVLKNRGYRWSPGLDGRPKAWVRTVPSRSYDTEMFFLRHEIYRGDALPVVRRLGAVDRFR